MADAQADIIEKLTRSASEALVKLRVRSALNPALLFTGIIGTPAVLGAVFSSGTAQLLLLGLAAVPVLITAAGFLYFMIRDPDKLQSEEYQIQKRALDIIEEKGSRIPIIPTSIEAITNPAVRMLAASEDIE